MTDLDLEKLGEQWRQQPDPAELEELRRGAESARRRARFAQAGDAGLALVVSGIVLLLLAFSSPTLESVLAGAGAILLMLVVSVRQRQLRKLELNSLTGSTEEMLDQSIARLRAAIKRARIALIASPPGFLLGLMFAAALDSGSGSTHFARMGEIAIPFALAVLAFLAAVFVHLLRSMQRSQRELERVTALRDAYREESAANVAE